MCVCAHAFLLCMCLCVCGGGVREQVHEVGYLFQPSVGSSDQTRVVKLVLQVVFPVEPSL